MNPDTIFLMTVILYAARNAHTSPNTDNMRKAYQLAKALAEVVAAGESQGEQ